jgi:hypothetical protein
MTAPTISGWAPQKQGNVPAVSNMTFALSSEKKSAVLRLSSLAWALWPTGSPFVQVMESPTLIVMGSGTNLKFSIADSQRSDSCHGFLISRHGSPCLVGGASISNVPQVGCSGTLPSSAFHDEEDGESQGGDQPGDQLAKLLHVVHLPSASHRLVPVATVSTMSEAACLLVVVDLSDARSVGPESVCGSARSASAGQNRCRHRGRGRSSAAEDSSHKALGSPLE